MAALQVVLVCGTLLMALGLLPFLYFVAHWYLMQGSPLETWDSPPRSLIRRLSARGERGKPRSTDGNRGEHALTQKPETQLREGQLDDPPLDGKPGRSISFQQADSTREEDEGAKEDEVSREMGSQEESLDGNRRRSSLSLNLQQTCSSSKVRGVLAHVLMQPKSCMHSDNILRSWAIAKQLLALDFVHNGSIRFAFAQTAVLATWDWLEKMYYAVDSALRRSLHDSMHTLVTVIHPSVCLHVPCSL